MNTFALKFLFTASKGRGSVLRSPRFLVCSDAVDRIPDDRIPETVKSGNRRTGFFAVTVSGLTAMARSKSRE